MLVLVVVMVVVAVPVVIVVAWPGRQWPDGGSGTVVLLSLPLSRTQCCRGCSLS